MVTNFITEEIAKDKPEKEDELNKKIINIFFYCVHKAGVPKKMLREFWKKINLTLNNE